MWLWTAIVLIAASQLGCSNAEQVTVPNLHQMSITQAYAELREMGLEVEIDGSFHLTPNHTSWVEGHAPEAGNELEVGSVVTIHPGWARHGLLAVSRKQMEPIVVPPIVGERLEAAARMLDDASLLWDANEVGPLARTDAPTLYSNYEVVRTSIKPGRRYDQVTRGVKPLRLWVESAEE